MTARRLSIRHRPPRIVSLRLSFGRGWVSQFRFDRMILRCRGPRSSAMIGTMFGALAAGVATATRPKQIAKDLYLPQNLTRAIPFRSRGPSDSGRL